ncbi:cytidine deaminase [Rubrobacter xylanophilus]|uniref:Cytidine deaminase n=1 Tax=Rubrobacter xylanophilus TaxID=49319 RepID=A0A510HI74_9ACTN|nr:cytidine deaminase [Rubrobacter xylanophilus]BBL78965.1 cytidine deaminase [Rubrobacter xylanophilus]
MQETKVDPERAMRAAREAAARAYAPYSRFCVGATLVTGDGALYSGCNVENASYGLSMCAERNAIGAMVLAGGDRRVEFVAVHSPQAAPCLPCGACRQVLREFGCRAVVVEEGGALRTYPFEEILPNAFGPEAL